MNEKPEALRLADDFDRSAKRELFRYLDLDKAAAELRRLHAENERLREALQDIARQPEGDEDSAQAVAKAALRREET